MYTKKLPSGSYRVWVSTGKKNSKGKYIYKTFTDPDKTRAIRMASEWADEHRDAEEAGTFGDALSAYVEASRARLSPSTVRDYTTRANVLRDEYPKFWGLSVDRVTRKDLQSLVNKLSDGRKPKSVRNYVGLISAAITDAGYSVPKIKLPEPVAPNTRVPEPCEVEWLLKIIEGTPLYVPVLLAAYGTMRDGEICALTMDDVHDEYIHVHRDIVQGDDKKWYIKESPKNEQSNRMVSFPAWIIKVVRENGNKSKSAPARFLDHTVTDLDGQYVTEFHPFRLSKVFSRKVDEYGFDHFTFHRLRAFSVSELAGMGIPDQYIVARGGWATDNVMKRHYRRALQTKQDEVNQKISSHYAEKNK